MSKNLPTFERLMSNVQLMHLKALGANQKFLSIAHNKKVIIEQAIVNYQISSTAVPLMETVIDEANKRFDCPTSELLIGYMHQHIPEETGHHLWCLSDLKNLGVNEETVRKRIPCSAVSALIGSQYHLIKHVHPIAFMGYIAALETNPPTPEYVNELMKKSNLGKECFSNLLHHSIADIAHKDDIINVVNSLSINEEQYRVLERSAFLSFRYVAQIMESVCAYAE